MGGGNILLGSLLQLYAGLGYGWSFMGDTLRDTLGTFVTTLEALETLWGPWGHHEDFKVTLGNTLKTLKALQGP